MTLMPENKLKQFPLWRGIKGGC